MAHNHSTRNSHKSAISPATWLGLIAGTTLLLGGLALLAIQTRASAGRIGNAVEFTLPDFSGKAVKLSDYRGHPVVVNLWASWCIPCRAEMPTLIRFYQDHQAEGLVFLAVNSSDDSGPAQQFATRVHMPFPVLYDPDGRVMRLLGADALPDTFVIDRTGTVRFAWTGEISSSVLDQRVAPLLTQ